MPIRDQKRKHEMERMRFKEGKTLKEISIIYDISRERVRQIIGNTGKGFRKEWTRNKIGKTDLSSMTKEEIALLPGINKVWMGEYTKARHPIVGGYAKTGAEWEERASMLLKQKGFDNELMLFRCPFDIRLESGLRIDVKAPSSLIQSPSQRGYSWYSVSNLKGGHFCDFFMVMIPNIPKRIIFIVPAHVFKGKNYARFCYPSRYKTKYDQYRDRYDLLTS